MVDIVVEDLDALAAVSYVDTLTVAVDVVPLDGRVRRVVDPEPVCAVVVHDAVGDDHLRR
jgi:hypothetical protein